MFLRSTEIALKTGDDFKVEYRAAGGLQKLYREIAKDFSDPG